MKVLVTGANGFVGQATTSVLAASGHEVVRAVRYAGTVGVSVGEIGPLTDWSNALNSCDTVVHLAARVHVMNDLTIDPLATFREVNTIGTLNLANQAAAAGVRRFVFVSSIKVNGEQTGVGQFFRAGDIPHPEDPYGVSKRDAEDGLREIAAHTGMDVVVIRPPLVYGPGVKGNFATMMRWLKRGFPLPLGSVNENRRSLVALDNLVDLIMTCIEHSAAANQTFLVSDGEDLSTADLLRRLGAAMGKPSWLLSVSPGLLMTGATMLGKGDIAQRLLGNLQVDISHTRQILSWTPPIGVDEGLRRAVRGLV